MRISALLYKLAWFSKEWTRTQESSLSFNSTLPLVKSLNSSWGYNLFFLKWNELLDLRSFRLIRKEGGLWVLLWRGCGAWTEHWIMSETCWESEETSFKFIKFYLHPLPPSPWNCKQVKTINESKDESIQGWPILKSSLFVLTEIHSFWNLQ